MGLSGGTSRELEKLYLKIIFRAYRGHFSNTYFTARVHVKYDGLLGRASTKGFTFFFCLIRGKRGGGS